MGRDVMVGHVAPRLRGGVWWVGGVENVRWGMGVGDGWGLLCGDSGVWAGEAPGDDAWVAVEWGGCSGRAGDRDGAM